MGAEAGYGTQVEVLAGLLEVLGDAAMVLPYDEDSTFAALSLSRFGAVGSSRLDWRGAEVLRSSAAFDGAELRRMLCELASPGEPVQDGEGFTAGRVPQ
ncbi:hypothetical protein C4J65_14690 [Streptomyces sp. CB09001]|nr:hypothetical protein C4J65_14690 [Streptomyces sp. CB09001]